MVVFSDLHGHLEALQQLLASTAGPWISVGDVLGSGGGNVECLRLLEERALRCTLGNHEVDLRHLYKVPRDFIRRWPLELVHPEAFFTHTLIEEGRFLRVHHAEEARELLRKSEGKPVFIGHTHLPGYWEVGDSVRWHPVYGEHELTMLPGLGYVVNLGSLGEPSAPGHPRYVEWEGTRVRWCRLTAEP